MFTVQNIRTQADQDLLEAMLAANPDPGVRMRPTEQVELARTTGQSYLVWQDGRPCACSLLYKFDCRQADGRIYSEIGTQLVLAEGFGLQVFMAKLHVLQTYLEEEGTDLNAMFAVVASGTPSEHNLRKHVGLSDWNVPEALAMERGRLGVPFNAAKHTLGGGPGVLSVAAADLKRWHVDDKRFITPKLEADIRCDLPWLVPDTLVLEG